MQSIYEWLDSGKWWSVITPTTGKKIDYMHYNPVKAGLCEAPEQYLYSSYRFYELNENTSELLTHYAEHL
jgi:hypothetical protein